MKKERLDKILFERGFFETKSKAAAAILAGNVKVNDEKITKSGFLLPIEKPLNIEVKSLPYVSRGGLKLEKAIAKFSPLIEERICLDAGASTGGFTDCLLQNKAKKVYAVDVGYGQIAWKLRSDPRVKVIERTNLKICKPDAIYAENDEIAGLLVSDLSFISLEKVLPNLKTLMKTNHEMICLIKPQFEAGKDLVEKGGVVRDKKVHVDVINSVIDYAKSLGYKVMGLTFSPIKGPSGNIEYLIYIATEGSEQHYSAQNTVEEAFTELNPSVPQPD